MELIYTHQPDGFDPHKRYRNPEHFDRVEAGVTRVVVIGDWPKVLEAYTAAGAEVTALEAPAHLPGAGCAPSELADLIGKLRAESDTIRYLVDGLEAGEVPRPEAGELAIRLFDALDGIRLHMAELAGARDRLGEQNETLRTELAELKAGEGQAVEALKAVLDAAGVPYRANASKETLEKLATELPRA